MSQVSTYHIFEKQIPEFIAADSPKFVAFMEAYYRFLEDYQINIESIKDVDLSPDDLLQFLKNEFAPNFPSARINDRKLLEVVNYLFKRKGTASAIELLFEIFYNEVITTYEPNKDLLRASDGVWQQLSFITLEHTYVKPTYASLDDIMPINKQLVISNELGVFYVDIVNYEHTNAADKVLTRFFFRTFRDIKVFENQAIDILEEDGELAFRGILVKSPARLKTVLPGESWKKGQLIFIESEAVPTIAVVKNVGTNGELINTEIIQHGWPHAENKTVFVNPYPNKPGNANYDIVITPVAYNPLTEEFTYEYELTLFEETTGFTEATVGLSDIKDDANYFLEDYPLEYYSAKQVLFVESVTGSVTNVINIETDVSYTDWLAARTNLVYEFDLIVRTKGEWVDGRGQLSNPDIRLQDGYYYQLFSYVVRSQAQIADFLPILNLVHPAGYKAFGELSKVAAFTYEVDEVSRVLSQDTIYLDNVVLSSENISLNPTKPLSSTNTVSQDNITSTTVGKAISTVTNQPTDVINSFTVVSQQTDEQIVSEEATNNVSKPISTLTNTTTDAIQTADTVLGKTEAINSIDSVSSISINTITNETVTVSDDIQEYDYIVYNEEAYADEVYVYNEHILTIG